MTNKQKSRAGIGGKVQVAGVLLVAAVASMTLSACGAGGGIGGSGGNSLAAASSKITEPAPVPARADLQDPRTVKGLSEVSDIGDIVPITDAPQPQLPVNFTDADGHEVTVADTSRILGLDLYGTYSRVIEGLGMADKLVGRSVSSTENAAAHLPVVTKDGHTINVEAVLQLKPSVIIVDHSIGPDDAINQLRDAGIAVAVLDPQRTIESVPDDIRLVANALGLKKEGEALAERSMKQLKVDQEQLAKLIPEDAAKRPKMAFLYVRGNGAVFFIMGKGYGTDVLIDALGGDNVAKDIEGIRPANAEALAKINPEVILVMTKGLESTGGVEGLLKRPGVAQTIAGKNKRIVSIPDGQSLSFGPQAGAQLLATGLALYAPENNPENR